MDKSLMQPPTSVQQSTATGASTSQEHEISNSHAANISSVISQVMQTKIDILKHLGIFLTF